jgi:uncharacterized phiE125 gp8 family phage protein
MSLTRVTAPPVHPVSESEAWAHLRLTMDQYGVEPSDRAHVQSLIAAATSRLDGRDGILGRCLVPQMWDYTIDQFPPTHAGDVQLRLPPIIAIESVSYVDSAGDVQTMEPSDYELSADRSWRPYLRTAHNASWPTTRHQRDAVTIRMQCGYDSGNSPQDAAGVPQAIKHALLLLISDLYEHRETVTVGTSVAPMPMTVDALLAPYRLLKL